MLGTVVRGAAAGSMHTLLVSDHGQVYACGQGRYGRLGLGHEKNSFTMTEVKGAAIKNTRIQSVVCGWDFSLACGNGRVYAWGRGDVGQCGVDDSPPSGLSGFTRPVLVTGDIAGSDVVQLAAGFSHTIALTDEGRMYSWGQGEGGQLGNCQVLATLPQRVRVSPLYTLSLYIALYYQLPIAYL